MSQIEELKFLLVETKISCLEQKALGTGILILVRYFSSGVTQKVKASGGL
jgi:hypothetical protein